MLNTATLIGRLGRDPELRYTGNGTAVAQFSIAVERDFKNGQGERETDWFDIVAWRQLAELVAEHLSKGRMVAVQGRLQTRTYDDKDGNRRKVTEIVADRVHFLGGKDKDDDTPREQRGGKQQQPADGFGDDEPPF
ncbi:MAG: single-stranded DNA-binding protein [Chloroflexota bacterium]|nr:single-stranded DNA-binding protein [Chloroflexota bacterium]